MIGTYWRTPQELRGYRLHKSLVFTTRKKIKDSLLK